MTEDSLLSTLSLLANSIVRETTSYIDSGRVKEVQREYLRPEFYDFDCQPYGIKCSVKLMPEERTEWNSFNRSLFFREVIEELPEYKEVRDAAEKKRSDREFVARSALSDLAELIVSKTYEGTINNVLNEYISIYLNDLENKPISWTCKSWLTGIWLEKESLEISPHIHIRKPEPDDIEEEWIISIESMKKFGSDREFDPLYPTIIHPGKEYGHLRAPFKGGDISHHIVPKLSAVMELSCQTQASATPHSYQAFQKAALILDCLTFFGTGAAFPIKTAIHPTSFVEMSTYYVGDAQIPTEPDAVLSGSYRYLSDYYLYQLNESEIPKFAKFVQAMRLLYPGEGIVHSVKRDSPVRIAFSRYQSALLSQSSGIAGQITSSMMALEALLLKDTEKSKLSKKLRKRTCTLMKYFGWHPVAVYQDVKKSYEIRSEYVHGSVKLLTADHDAVERAKRALAYARNTLLLFLHLKILDDADKNAFIDEIIDEITKSARPQVGYSKLSKKIPQQRWLCQPR